MERRLERSIASKTASFFILLIRVPLFHLFHLYPIYQVKACDTNFPACAGNGGTDMVCFEWGELFHLCSIAMERWYKGRGLMYRERCGRIITAREVGVNNL